MNFIISEIITELFIIVDICLDYLWLIYINIEIKYIVIRYLIRMYMDFLIISIEVPNLSVYLLM